VTDRTAASPPTDAPGLRWGIAGTGGIAGSFARDLRLEPDAGRLVAVGSRSPERAREFAATVRGPDAAGSGDTLRAHGTLDDLAADPDIDVVYVAVPHTAHHEVARRMLTAGKAVLLEKPFTVSRTEADDLVQLARKQGVFLMEAMWTRFLPHVQRIRELLAEGRLGEVRLLVAEHGVWFRHNPAHRMFDPALGGGALLDLGIYPISFAAMLFGEPAKVTTTASFGDTGVDGQTAVTLSYENGAQAVLSSSMEAWLPNRATIAGRDARIEIDGMFYRPGGFTLVDRHGASERYTFTTAGGGLQYQALEVARCIAAGLTESPVLPLDESVCIMGTLDRVRAAIGLRYPGEDA
jgi:predicted dehydrogenase